MFGSKKRNNPIKLTKLSSLIAEKLEVGGDVYFAEGLRIDGKVQGKVVNREGEAGLLVVSVNGRVEGDVHAYDAVINGMIEGDLRVEHFLELQSQARVIGNITYRQLQMDCGAAVQGQLVAMDEQVETQSDKVLPFAAAEQA